MDLKEFKKFLETLNQENIKFDSHFYKRCKQRPINESLVRSFLSNPNKLEKIEKGNKNRLKSHFKMSNRYSLIVIIEIVSKSLKVISAWNTHRKWQNKLKK